jgi:hypothetical protein
MGGVFFVFLLLGVLINYSKEKKRSILLLCLLCCVCHFYSLYWLHMTHGINLVRT